MRRVGFGVLAFLILATMAFGQDVSEPQNDGFDTSLSLGLGLTDGNSETMQANASLETEGEKAELGSVRAGLEANYGESTVDDDKETTAENARLFAGARKTMTELSFWSLNGEYLYDDIAEIDYRATIGPGFGYYFVKNERTALSLDIGPAYIWERVAGVSDNYLAIRFAERFDRKIGPAAKVWQSLEYIPTTEDFNDYLINAELGIEAAINSRMKLRVVLQDSYDSTPGEDLEQNDVSLIAGLSISL